VRVIGGLRASLLLCALFLVEDPLVVAVRTRLAGSTSDRIVIDVLLGAAMIAYNFVASRYVTSATSAAGVLDAIDRVDAERAERLARTRHPVAHAARRAANVLNPFHLIRTAGSRLGRALDGVSVRARRRRLRRTAALLEDLGVVNILGVPGASLARSTGDRALSRRGSLRHCLLFVGSWFAGARAIEWFVGWAHRVPVLGVIAAQSTRAVGSSFDALTNVTRPVGAVTVALVMLTVLRYATEVERAARTNPTVGPSS
jgi:hypothetical protein